MPIIDIIIVIGLVLSVVVGFVRGFVKEAISIATLLVAIWSTLYFGPAAGNVFESSVENAELRLWIGRLIVFAVVLSAGGLLGWGVAKLVRFSPLSGLDRLVGCGFGVLRGVLVVALLIIAGEAIGFENDPWWQNSALLPHVQVVADWIREMAPAGFDLIVPDETAEELPVQLPAEL